MIDAFAKIMSIEPVIDDDIIEFSSCYIYIYMYICIYCSIFIFDIEFNEIVKCYEVYQNMIIIDHYQISIAYVEKSLCLQCRQC